MIAAVARRVPTKVAAPSTWECRACPAWMGGKPCSSLNVSGANVCGPLSGHPGIEFCAACGCTKLASDDRARREAAQ